MTVSKLGPGGYPRPPYGSFAGKVLFVPSRSFVQTFTRLGPGGYSRPPYGSFGGKVAFVPPAVPDAAFLFGGVGHFLYERERAKQLAAITRKAPAPIDRTTRPQFMPLASPPVAAPAPAVDMAAVQQQRMATQAAAVARRRRDEEAILLLAS